MCSTAAVQVNLDAGADAADVARRWALLHAIGPTMVAAFANSPVHAGRRTGWRSYRQAVWQRLDPPRTGAPRGADPAAAWARYTLDAPVLAIPGQPWRADPGLTFRQWLTAADAARAGEDAGGGVPSQAGSAAGAVREAVAGRPPLDADLAFHASTLFPPVRPRGWLEVRYVDALPPRWWPVPVAVLTALTADRAAGDAALEAVAATSADWLTAARDGLSDPALARAAEGCFDAAVGALRRAGVDATLVEAYRDTYVARARCPADDREALIT
jgi:glutamate--cysteine ligase